MTDIEMFFVIIYGIIFYNLLAYAIEFFVIQRTSCVSAIAVTPWTLRDSTNLNWFGCWLCAIMVRILNPTWSIVYFFYWITHI